MDNGQRRRIEIERCLLLLRETEYIEKSAFDSIRDDAVELARPFLAAYTVKWES